MSWILACLFLLGIISALFLLVYSGRRIPAGTVKARQSYLMAAFMFFVVGIFTIQSASIVLSGEFPWWKSAALIACTFFLAGVAVFLVIQGKRARM